MDEREFKKRTYRFALEVIKLVDSLQRKPSNLVIGKQLLRAGTGVGSNYRASCRARSTADMISKLGVVEEEADESIYWLELLVESGSLSPDAAKSLIQEANEFIAMTVSSIRTLRDRK